MWKFCLYKVISYNVERGVYNSYECQPFCMEVKHGAWKKVGWEYCDAKRDWWWEQYLELSSQMKNGLRTWYWCSIRVWCWRSKKEGEAENDMLQAGSWKKLECWFEQGRCTLKWIIGVNQIATTLRWNQPSLLVAELLPDINHCSLSQCVSDTN